MRIFKKCAAGVIIAILMICSSTITSSATSSSVDVSKDDNYTVMAEFGYTGNSICDSKWMPVSITISNETSSDLGGEAILELYYSWMQGSYAGTPVVSYSTEIIVPAKTEKTYTIYINLNDKYNINTYKVVLTDDAGRDVFQGGTYQIPRSVAYQMQYLVEKSFYVGVLSDDENSLKYLQDAYLNRYAAYASVYTEVIKPERFPVNKAVVMDFDLLILNDIDLSSSSKLSDMQKQCLEYYIECGGRVIVCSGTLPSRMGDYFSKYFGQGATFTEENKSVTVNVSLYDFNDGTYSEDLQNISKISVYPLDSDQFKTLGSPDVLSGIYKHNKYNFYYLPWNLADASYTYVKNIVSHLYDVLFNNDVISSNSFNGYPTYTAYGRNNMRTALSGLMRANLPSTALIAAVLAIYIIIAIPLAYLFLRKKKRLELMWITLPCTAIIFTVIIFIYSYSLNYLQRNTYSASIIQLNPYSEEQHAVYQVAALVTSSNGENIVSFADTQEGALFGENLSVNYTYNYGYSTNANENIQYLHGSKRGVRLIDQPLWSTTMVEGIYMPNTESTNKYGSVDMQVTSAKDEIIEITITNNTGRDLKKAFITFYGIDYTFDSFNRGESQKLIFDVGKIQLNEIDIYLSGIITKLYGGANSYGSSQEFESTMLYTTAIDAMSNRQADSIFFFAVDDNGNTVDMLMNGERESRVINTNIVYQVIPLSSIYDNNGDMTTLKYSAYPSMSSYNQSPNIIYPDSNQPCTMVTQEYTADAFLEMSYSEFYRRFDYIEIHVDARDDYSIDAATAELDCWYFGEKLKFDEEKDAFILPKELILAKMEDFSYKYEWVDISLAFVLPSADGEQYPDKKPELMDIYIFRVLCEWEVRI